ncbi:MAG: hypothetical protein QM539_01685 [Alphaproteobacteria bacterium]|nr:hypothetical protein [Alphaproteobacteria bacterium]
MLILKKYIHTAKDIINKFDGLKPFNKFLKGYFYENHKFGSRDRRMISNICYSIFRLGASIQNLHFNDQAKVALFLNDASIDIWAEIYDNDWILHWHKSIPEKIEFVNHKYPDFNFDNMFPFKYLMSNHIKFNDFIYSFLKKPEFFIRLRPGYEEKVQFKLNQAEINYTKISNQILSFKENIDLEKFLLIDIEAVIQDINSQRVCELLKKIPPKNTYHVLDACAGAGGKTILIHDTLEPATISINDIRTQKIKVLQKRLLKARIQVLKYFNLDLTTNLIFKKFNLILIDAPCSGSGTWIRTPEAIKYFENEHLSKLRYTQTSIIKNCLEMLEVGGYLLYVTCSVFKSENEDLITHIISQNDLELIESQYFIGYENHGETLYGALLKKNN